VNLTLPLFDDWPEAAPAARPSALPGPPPGQATDPAGLARDTVATAGVDTAADARLDATTDEQADALAGAVLGAPWVPASDATGSQAGRLTALHPGLWRASQMGGGVRPTTATGFAQLDAQLPGGGWPHGVLTELLLPQTGVGELRLLAPALAQLAPPDQGRCVMLFDPPASLSAWAVVQGGMNCRHWLVVQARSAVARPASPRRGKGVAPLLPNADVLWALEQSLQSGHVGAVLAWLPNSLRADALRRLQLAAQAHDGPVFIFREAAVRSQPSAAPLRLLLQPAGADGLWVRVLKRRGPALAQPIRLGLPSALTPGQHARVLAQQALGQARLAAQAL
jgi:protein ImuA